MKEAVIVSTARTGLAKSYRGSFNVTKGPTLAGWAVEEAVKRAGIDPGEIDDCIMGCAMQQGTTGQNIGRLARKVKLKKNVFLKKYFHFIYFLDAVVVVNVRSCQNHPYLVLILALGPPNIWKCTILA